MKTLIQHNKSFFNNWKLILMMMIMFIISPIANVFSQSSIVNLGTSGDFVVLAKTGISSTGSTDITGDMGVSPIDHTAITGFGLILDASGTFSTSSLVTGKVYAANYTAPTPVKLTTAIGDMETAYTDAAGRTSPDHTELYAGDLTGKTLTPGLYKWGTGVLVSEGGVTISGNENDIWIFQIAQDLSLSNGAMVTLSGGARASNIFWQVAGQTTIGTTAAMKGIILCQTQIVFNTGASFNGKALAQTAITLDANQIVNPVITSVGNGTEINNFALLQNYPNPFNPNTTIQYNLENAVHVTLRVYNLLGSEVAILVNDYQEAGSYKVIFDIGNLDNSLANGVYFYRLQAGEFVSTKKIVLLK
jgi:hypothetical protein